MGAVGIAQTFMRAGERGGGIEGATGYIYEKLLNLQELMYTDSAREIAEGRHALLQRFVDRPEDETEGGRTSPVAI